MEQHCTDLSHPTNKYALDVVEGRIVAGPIVRAACKRHLDDLRDGPARGWVFSEAKSGRALRFFPAVLRLNGGDFEGKPFNLVPPHEFIIGSLFGWVNVNTGYRRFRIAYVETSKGSGKSPLAAGIGLYGLIADNEPRAEIYAAAPLALDTPVATTLGWKKQGDLVVGDKVFDENGKPCNVIGTSKVFKNRQCYDVEFDDGTVITTDANHVWKTVDTRGQAIHLYPPALVTTEQIAKTLRAPSGRLRHRIPVAGELQLPECDLPIDPETLGIWLGDGRSNRGGICYHKDDFAILDPILAAGYEVSQMNPQNNTMYCTIRGLRTQLRLADMLDNKHVPDRYLRASREQRLALLRGLMSTDGSCDTKGGCSFTNRNFSLAAAVHDLAGGLGLRSNFREYKVTGSPYFGVAFVAPKSLQVFGMKRKSARQQEKLTQRVRGRYIRRVTPVDSVPVKCISVDSESNLYLVSYSFIATHNTKKDQAMILFKDAVAAFEMSPALSSRIKPSGKQPNVWNLYDEKTGSYFRPISSDDGQSGHRPHMALVDELHEHKNAQVVNMMSAGQKGRTQPLVFIITNSGSDKTSVCGEYHDKAERISFGMEKDDSFFGYVASLDKDDDPFVDEECWIKANPLLGVTIQKQYIREQIAAATMPSKKSDVMRLNFCMWTAADNPFIDFNSWSSSKAKYDLSIFSGRDDVSLGLDLSQVCDLTAGVFSIKRDGVIHWWAEFWIPEGVVATKVKEDKVPYDHWIREGWVRATPGNTIDLGFVAKDLKELQKKHNFKLRSVPYDRWRIEDFKKACDSVDFRVKDQLQEFGQGFKDMSPAIDEFERSLMDSKFRHPGNPCLDWCAANAVVISDPAGGRKLDKGSNQKKRIDGIIAGIMSHHATSLLPEQALPTIRWL